MPDPVPPTTWRATGSKKDAQHLTDSIVAAMIDNSVGTKARNLLMNYAKAQWLVQRLASGDAVSRADFNQAALVLPEGIFPLPVDNVDLKDQRKAQAEANKAASDARAKRLTKLTTDLANHRGATQELLTAFEKSGAQIPAAKKSATAAQTAPTAVGFLLTDTAVSALSAPTKAVLKNLGVVQTQVDVAKSVTLPRKRKPPTFPISFM